MKDTSGIQTTARIARGRRAKKKRRNWPIQLIEIVLLRHRGSQMGATRHTQKTEWLALCRLPFPAGNDAKHLRYRGSSYQ